MAMDYRTCPGCGEPMERGTIEGARYSDLSLYWRPVTAKGRLLIFGKKPEGGLWISKGRDRARAYCCHACGHVIVRAEKY